MRAVGFFLVVFLSMLSVFLVATGEVKRWFSGSRASPIQLVEIGEAAAPPGGATRPGKNLLEFSFYNVEQGRKSFTMRADFQDDFPLGTTGPEEIRRLTLKEGTLEVPLSGSFPSGPEGEGGAPKAQHVLLEFRSAVYVRGSDSGSGNGKEEFEVLLEEGKGTLEDGTEFLFEDLSFTSDTAKKEEDPAATLFRLRSAKPVFIHNQGFELRSPAGFAGTLKGQEGLRDLTFLPPVSAVFDPQEKSVLRMEAPIQLPEAPPAATPGESALATAAGAPGNSGKTGEGSHAKVAVSCQGPLTLKVEAPATGSEEKRRHHIRFEKDVVIYPLEPEETRAEATGPAKTERPADRALAAAAIPPPGSSRFECQLFEIDLEETSGGLVPVKAVASMAALGAQAPAQAARVKLFIQKGNAGPLYTVDGDRLEWAPRVVEGTDPTTPTSEAILYGQPTFRGDGMEFHAERAAFREDRLFLERVDGTIERAPTSEKSSRKAKKDQTPLAPLGEIFAEGGGLLEPANAPAEAGEPDPPNLPLAWDVSADRAEFQFLPGEGGGAARKLSRFIADSEQPDGVKIRSRPPAATAADTGPGVKDPPYRITGKSLTYDEKEKKVTIAGTETVKPRFALGKSWLESRKIHVLLGDRDEIAYFDDEVVARIEDLNELARKKENEGGALKDEKASDQSGFQSFDVEGSRLAIHFPSGRIRDVRASGVEERPVRVTARSSESSRWFRFVGPELYWNNEREIAQISGLAARDASARPAPGPARIEFEGGEVTANRIRFDRRSWKAVLEDGVLLRLQSGALTEGAESNGDGREVLVKAGKTDVEFHPQLADEGAERQGKLAPLAKIKSLHGQRSTEEPIEIRSGGFIARGETCDWDAATRQLRLHGSGFQEIEIVQDDFHGPIRAKEILFKELEKVLILQGSVTGRLVQPARGETSEALPGARVTPAAAPSSPASPREAAPFSGKDLVWDLATNAIEADLREAGDGFQLAAVRARDQVELRNEELGVELLGDDLLYDAATRRLRIFSPSGRPQTLLCDAAKVEKFAKQGEGQATAAQAPSPPRLHKIVAQEIWALLHKNPLARPGEPAEWLLVQFQKDVIGSFPMPPAKGESRYDELGDTWKMVAEKLTLYIDPTQRAAAESAVRKQVRWVVASGNVDFSSGALRATADRANFEVLENRLTLIGAPARVLRENKRVFEDPEITLRRSGKEDIMEYSGPRRPEKREASVPAPPPVPVDAKR